MLLKIYLTFPTLNYHNYSKFLKSKLGTDPSHRASLTGLHLSTEALLHGTNWKIWALLFTIFAVCVYLVWTVTPDLSLSVFCFWVVWLSGSHLVVVSGFLAMQELFTWNSVQNKTKHENSCPCFYQYLNFEPSQNFFYGEQQMITLAQRSAAIMNVYEASNGMWKS